MVLRDVQDGSLPMTDLEYMGRVAGRSDVQVYRGVDFGTILHRNLVRNTETPYDPPESTLVGALEKEWGNHYAADSYKHLPGVLARSSPGCQWAVVSPHEAGY